MSVGSFRRLTHITEKKEQPSLFGTTAGMAKFCILFHPLTVVCNGAGWSTWVGDMEPSEYEWEGSSGGLKTYAPNHTQERQKKERQIVRKKHVSVRAKGRIDRGVQKTSFCCQPEGKRCGS